MENCDVLGFMFGLIFRWDFFWIFTDIYYLILRVEPVSYQQLTGSHLVTVKRTIIYTASLSDHNNGISCRVTQKYLQSDRVIYAR